MRDEIFTILAEAQGSIRPEHHPNVLTHQILTLIKEKIGKMNDPYITSYQYGDSTEWVVAMPSLCLQD